MILERLVSLLHHCTTTNSHGHGATAVHAAAIKAGHAADLFLSNHLLNLYAKSGRLSAAHNVFDEMPRRNLVSWSALISGYDQAGRPALALEVFAQMDARPNEYVYASVARACAGLRALATGMQVHADALKNGYLGVSFVANSLVSMYMKCGRCDEAYAVFGTLPEPNVVSYNAVISGFAENSQTERGLEVFGLMKRRGLRPDWFSYAGVLGICGTSEDLCAGALLHCEAVKLGLDVVAFVGNVVLAMYSKCGAITEAEKVFWSMEEKDVVAWNTYIAACSRCSDHAKALMVFKDMVEMAHGTSVSPDDFTLASTLAACVELASIRHGGQVHAHLIRRRADIDIGVSNAIIDMYAKCGQIVHASRVFDRLPCRNSVSWNTMIAGLGNHGHGKAAVEMFEQMREAGFAPDSVTFTGLLAACTHAGLVSKGLGYFNCMRETYGISPGVEHISCLIDLLGRAGRLEEAEGYVCASPFSDNPVIWGSLLSASRVHRDVDVGERVARRLFELGPSTSSPFVLLSHLYASDARWDSVAKARKMLKDTVAKKEPGYSIIEVKGAMEKFTAGDFSHARMEEVIETLHNLKSQGR